MAFSHQGSQGVGNKTAESQTQITLVAARTVDELIVVMIACDNAGTGGTSPISSVTDSVGNTYTPRQTVTQSPGGAANDGLTVAIYTTRVTTEIPNGGTIDVNWSPNVTAKAIAYRAFTGSTASNAIPTDGNVASGAGTTYSVGPSASMVVDDLIAAVAGNESGTALAADTDTSNGSWATGSVVSGGTGGDATKMAARHGYKIVTGSGTQTYNAATGANTDWAAAYVVFTFAEAIPRVPRFTPIPQVLAN